MSNSYRKAPLFGFLLLSCLSFRSAGQELKPSPVQLGKSPLKLVIATMTLEEKSRLVVGMGFRMPGFPAPSKTKPKPIDIGGFVLPASDPEAYSVEEKVPGAAGRTHAIARLGIPSITVSDGPAGLRIEPIRNHDSTHTFYATAFPVATLLASSWDTALVKQVGIAFGNEVREYGVDILLAPALNIHRNPLGGRNFEYYSEDPLIAGTITAAIVNGIQSNGVGTSIKHYAANNQETNRNSINTVVSQRAMREIYLKGFEIAVKASQPWTVMSSYNKLNGTYTSERRDLLTTILKDDWKFNGFVMTDWFGGKDAVAQMNAGNDLIMPGRPSQSADIVEAVKSGKLTMAQLNQNVGRMLKVILMSPTFLKYHYSDHPDLTAHAIIARNAGAQGMVLLKNDGNSLPLTPGINLAVFGNASYSIIAGGSGSGDVNKAYTVSLIKGLNDAGYKANEALSATYTAYIKAEKIKQGKPKNFFTLLPPVPEMPADQQSIDALAENSQAAILTIGRNAGEGRDRKIENDFLLTATEIDLINKLSVSFHAKGKKLIVILNIGGVIETASWSGKADAILLAWQPGQEAGNSIADIISGKVNPSGKLATTFPVKYEDVSSAKNFPGTPADKPLKVIYEEGIYVGYRYYETYKIKPAYAFGHGLSYTTFSLTGLNLSSPVLIGNKLTATVLLKNTGSVAGKQVVELYVKAAAGKIDKPLQELKGYAKSRLLQPGESETMTFILMASDLSSFYTESSAFIADRGTYEIRVGTSSDEISQTASFELPIPVITETVQKVLKPEEPINELKGL